MAEFYGNGLESAGHGRSSSWNSREPSPKEKSLLEKSLDRVLGQADELLKDALELAKSGRVQAKEEIEERIKAYTLLASITPHGPDQEKVADIRKHFEYSRRLNEFETQLKKEIFG